MFAFQIKKRIGQMRILRIKQTGYWLNVDGEVAHVLGSPNMSQETLNAFAELVRAARRHVDSGAADE